MYIPHAFRWEDEKEIFDFITEFNFGLLITQNDSRLWGTHLPFLLKTVNQKKFLYGHIASHNEQSGYIDGCNLMAVFQGPHAYISPELYSHQLNVPTWNYLSVHVYGKGKVLKEDNEKEEVLVKTILRHEGKFIQQWNNLPDNYKQVMKKEITVFEMEIKEIHAQKKLSQNKPLEDRKRIWEYLNQSNNTSEKILSEWMKKTYGF
ncbi:MAG: FMN-binding negative transcriptional regulator [Bacteroidia bacterium]|nr:FMN-binding negative transcriptional regulator [Bacteroidia bacterium]